jgi:DNA-binding CsgD family transcriptional regulator
MFFATQRLTRSAVGMVAAGQKLGGARSIIRLQSAPGSRLPSPLHSTERFLRAVRVASPFGINEEAAQIVSTHYLLETGRCRLKKVLPSPKLLARLRKQDATRPTSLVFCEKSTGVAQFEAGYAPDLDSDIERMASLLAMQCLVRCCEPRDYVILVPAEKELAGRVTARAKELLHAGMAVANPVPLSPRQTEILRAVVRNSANKEIAAKFNITVRTVKFHISTLLSKFGADNRIELARKATVVLRSEVANGESLDQAKLDRGLRREPLSPIALSQIPPRLANKARNVRFAPRVLSA